MNYKLTVYPALEIGETDMVFLFATEEEMNAASNTAADLLLFMQDQAKLMPDYANAFIKEKKVAGEWEEIE